ncbi:pilus assembly protein CpaE [Aeromicrobium sp. A1-2]|uniref:AAA family ATPase n=1 Tax=Aeromicrobium sp. A1-2 TaxID=2107713 RepID=UPI000E4BB111|nr:AAA family ATPase [Aeromicrobium sp. A1-2]AXT85881.1 pilus assembly protein CpaE [Aeromicrobium sp. A1-2]
MSRALILAGTAEFVARVNVLPGTQVVSLKRETIEAERFDLMRSLDPQSLPDLIFVGAALPTEIGFEIARRIDEVYPSIDLVLVDDVPLDTVVEAMRSGFRDVLPSDMPDDRLREVVRRAELHRLKSVEATASATAPTLQSPEESRTITVISPKGGVGKTSISTSLAIGLAEDHPSEVVLVDLDLQFGDVASTLDLVPAHTIEEALTPYASADNLIVKTMLTVHPSGFHVLCGAESPAANDEVTGAQIVRLLSQLSMQFRYVIVDTAGGLTEPTLAALEVTDDVVMVSTMDVACVRGVRKAVELLSQVGLLPTSRVLTLNLASNQSGMKVKDVEAAIGLPVDIVIARSNDVQLAANHGTPLMLNKKKGGPFVKSIRALITRLDQVDSPGQPTHKRLDVA